MYVLGRNASDRVIKNKHKYTGFALDYTPDSKKPKSADVHWLRLYHQIICFPVFNLSIRLRLK